MTSRSDRHRAPRRLCRRRRGQSVKPSRKQARPVIGGICGATWPQWSRNASSPTRSAGTPPLAPQARRWPRAPGRGSLLALSGRESVGVCSAAGWALNTVKRYARAHDADELLRPARNGSWLAEIREQGLHRQRQPPSRYINQSCTDPERATPSPRWLVFWIMSKSANQADRTRRHLGILIASCPEMTTLTRRVRPSSPQLRGQDRTVWTADRTARTAPPGPHRPDRTARTAASGPRRLGRRHPPRPAARGSAPTSSA
jgi:hypothetical protein